MDEMVVDPAVELTGSDLREVVVAILESGNINCPKSHAIPRMRERNVTLVQIVGCLRSGVLETEGFIGDSWRYRATGRGITVTFDVDEDGNVLVVVTTWRNK